MIAVAQGNTPSDIVDILQTKLITDIQKDTGFIVDNQNPETILKFTVTTFDYTSRQGTQRSDDSTTELTIINGNIEISYQALEAKTNAPLDSENLRATFNKTYKSTVSLKSNSSSGIGSILNGVLKPTSNEEVPPTEQEVKGALIRDIVKEMAQRATPVEESITVRLPQSRLESLSTQAMSQNWSKVIEETEKMVPFSKPEDDSYRHYLIGLSNEALAYSQNSNDPKSIEVTQEYLFKARVAYNKAISFKTNEKEFTVSSIRVDKALAQYDKIQRQIKQYKDYIANKIQNKNDNKGNSEAQSPAANIYIPGSSDSSKQDKSTSSDDDVWTNEKIINLWNTGNIDESSLLDIVLSATKFNFLMTPTKVTELYSAKLPASVIKALSDKVTPKNNAKIRQDSIKRGQKKKTAVSVKPKQL
jgi:hypothetical protein